jgi:predicted phosphodiesterase
MKLYAISDLHLNSDINRQALAARPSYPADWLILSGDTGETEEQLHDRAQFIRCHVKKEVE